MLYPNPEFSGTNTPKSRTPHGFRYEAFAKSSQGKGGTPNPVAKSNPNLRPESRVRSTPMWQAVLID